MLSDAAITRVVVSGGAAGHDLTWRSGLEWRGLWVETRGMCGAIGRQEGYRPDGG